MGPRGGAQGGGPAPTYLDFIRPDLEGLDDAGQEVFHLPEVTVADAPGPIHQEDQVHGGGGRAAELGAGWAAERAGLWARPPPLQGPRLLQAWSPSLGLVGGEGPRSSGRNEAGSSVWGQGLPRCLGLTRVRKPHVDLGPSAQPL